MGIYEKILLLFLSGAEGTTIFGKNLIICNFSRSKGDPSDIETCPNILLFVVEYSV